MTDERLISALYSIPSHDYEIWYRVASALKGALGDAGYDYFVSWSSTAPNHEKVKGSTLSCWRSVSGRVPIGFIFKTAKENGWQGDESEWKPDPGVAAQSTASVEADRQRRAEAAKQARRRAAFMVGSAQYNHHPYLEKKGFPNERGLVFEADLVVPVRSWRNSRNLMSVQTIDFEGNKFFLKGGQVGGGVFAIGADQHGIKWFCEGYATGLTIRRALIEMSRGDRDVIYVCFSAYNIQRVAQEMGCRYEAFVIADHDWHTCTNPECKHRWDQPMTGEVAECPECGYGRVSYPAGEKAARVTGLPYWVPPEPGTDANDLMVESDIEAVSSALTTLIY